MSVCCKLSSVAEITCTSKRSATCTYGFQVAKDWTFGSISYDEEEYLLGVTFCLDANKFHVAGQSPSAVWNISLTKLRTFGCISYDREVYLPGINFCPDANKSHVAGWFCCKLSSVAGITCTSKGTCTYGWEVYLHGITFCLDVNRFYVAGRSPSDISLTKLGTLGCNFWQQRSILAWREIPT